jgi:hypothetical protein
VSASGAPGRVERIALNEARFREINERLLEGLERLPGAVGEVEFVCECGRRDCRECVVLTRDDYETVRADPARFAVVPGHELTEAERVVDRKARYSVVEKFEDVADIVVERDPRA